MKLTRRKQTRIILNATRLTLALSCLLLTFSIGANNFHVVAQQTQSSTRKETPLSTQGSKEVAPAKDVPCFPGAYYRKAVSSLDVWTGIGGIVKLRRSCAEWKMARPP